MNEWAETLDALLELPRNLQVRALRGIDDLAFRRGVRIGRQQEKADRGIVIARAVQDARQKERASVLLRQEEEERRRRSWDATSDFIKPQAGLKGDELMSRHEKVIGHCSDLPPIDPALYD